MGLIKTPAFEGQEGADASTEATATTTTAVAAVAPTAVAAVRPVSEYDAVGSMKGSLPVDYNTLAQVKCTNGNFVEREGAINMGDTVVFELLSFQDSYTITTGDDKAPVELLKFSDDSITCKDGTPVADYLAYLKDELGYARASVKHRLFVVGAIQSASKSDKFNDTLMQFDFSPETRVLFQRYQATSAWGIRAGKLDADKVKTIKASTRLVTKGSNTFTVADFTTA